MYESSFLESISLRKPQNPRFVVTIEGIKIPQPPFFFLFFFPPAIAIPCSALCFWGFFCFEFRYLLKKKRKPKKTQMICVLCCAPYNWVLGAKNILKMCLGSSTSCYLISVLLSMKRIWSVTEELGRGSSETRMSSALEADLGLLVN